MNKAKLRKIILFAFLLVGFIFLLNLLYYIFDYHRPHAFLKNEVSSYRVTSGTDGEKILKFKNDSPHSMIHFQGANVRYENEALYLKLKYCSKPNLLCRLDLAEKSYNFEDRLYDLELPKGTRQVLLDFGKEGIVEVPNK